MQFHSLEYLLFLPLVFLLYWWLVASYRRQNILLLVASYVFYGWWDWRFLVLIVFTSLTTFLSGLCIERANRQSHRKAYMLANVVLNLCILGVFKYFNFFAESVVVALQWLGLRADAVTLQLLLPVGISFYTFQALSYSIDIYSRRLPACRDWVAFFAYISFFPQLVAGPIERSTHLLPQMLRPRQFRYAEAVDGLRQLLWGFAKKLIVADTCAMAVDTIWQSPAQHSSLMLAVAAVLFSIQIYGDFSGYSDIAVGSARLFGIELIQNFRTPYFAADIADFWRRWHISLMTWLRDYVYIPMGGSRCSRLRHWWNTLVVFLLSGLWHGAAWTFVCWGLFHACFVILSNVVSSFWVRVPSVIRVGATFAIVTFGWILFRAPDLALFGEYVHHLLTAGGWTDLSTLTAGKAALCWSVALLAVEWLQRDRAHGLDLPAHGLLRSRAVRWGLYYGLLLLIYFFHGQQQTFIYFQF